MLTEFGGLTYAPGTGDVWLGYGTVRTEQELTDRLGELVGAVCASGSVAGFCYTQLTDTEQERNTGRLGGLTAAGLSPLLAHPPKVSMPALVNSLNGVSARRLRAAFTGRLNRHLIHGHLWSRPTSPYPAAARR